METQKYLSYATYREITQQTAPWLAVIDEIQRQRENILQVWNSVNPVETLYTGCGSTFYLARTAAMIHRGVIGTLAEAYPASELLFFPDTVMPERQPYRLVAISRSGTTTETMRAVERFQKHQNSPVLAVSVYGDSTLVKQAQAALVAAEAHEESVAQTRSFSSMLVAVEAMLHMVGDRFDQSLFKELAPIGDQQMRDHAALARDLGATDAVQRYFFLGSGPLYGIANEAMLKMKEMTLSYSEAYHSLEFRHGPMSMVDNQTLVIGLLSDTSFDNELAVLQDMRALGAKILAISPRDVPQGKAEYVVRLPDGFSDFVRPVLYLPVLQLMAFFRSLHKGLNPDRPANLTAVVNLDL